MERKMFRTLFNKDHKLAKNPYVHGRIFGIAEIICEMAGEVTVIEDENGNQKMRKKYFGGYWTNKDDTRRYLETKCTEEQYERFKEYVEKHYPGLCEFYWEKWCCDGRDLV